MRWMIVAVVSFVMAIKYALDAIYYFILFLIDLFRDDK